MCGCKSSTKQVQTPSQPSHNFLPKKIRAQISSPQIFQDIVSAFHGTPNPKWVPVEDNCMYRGEWHEGRRHGQGLLYDLGKQVLVVGCFFEGKVIHLKYRLIYADGTEYFGEISEKWAKNGRGTLTGKGFKYKGHFINDLYEGKGVIQSIDYTFQGIFENGKKKSGKQTTTKGVFEGNYQNDLKEGLGTFEWVDGGRYQGEFHLGQIHGKGKLFDKDNTYIGKRTFQSGKLLF